MTELSILFVNYNSWRFCVRAVESIIAHAPTTRDGAPMAFEVIVVDNASPHRDPVHEAKLRELLARVNGQLIMHDENGGYAKGMNLAYAHSKGRWVLVSNPDVAFTPGCIDNMLRYIETHPEAGAVTPQLYVDRGLACRLPPNILPTLGDLLGTTMVAVSPRWVVKYSKRRTAHALRVWLATEPVELEQLSGCCLVMERSFIDQIGLFDPRFPLYYEDTDLSMRIHRAGRKMVEVVSSKLAHFYDRSAQTNHAEAMRRYWISRRTFYRKWYGPIGGWLFDFSRWLLDTKWMHALARRPIHPVVHELPTSSEAPTLHLPRSMSRFLVEISMDPRFYLAAGAFGSGDRWTPPVTLFEGFGPITYFFRVCDLTGSTPEQVGIYRYTRVMPAASPAPVAAAATPAPGSA